MGTIPDERMDLFEKPAIAVIASFLPSGHPQVAPVWVDYDGTHVLVVTRQDTRKYQNVQHDSRVTVTIIDPDAPHRYVEVRGAVAKQTQDGALDVLDRLAHRYWGVSEYPYHRDEPRAVLHIEPERIVAPTIETPHSESA